MLCPTQVKKWRECTDHDIGEAGILSVPQEIRAGEHEQQPQRSSEITEDSESEMDATDAAQPSRKENHEMLKITLAPATIPLRVFDDGRRTFLVTPLQIPRKPYLPVFFPHQCRFDKIMAEYLSTER